jgi:autotransporter translocation and assembly factor TamB
VYKRQVKGNIISTELAAMANQFYLTKHRNYEIQIDANTFIQTGNQQPRYGGWIKVLHSSFYLPALMGSSGSSHEATPPLLVQALAENDTSQIISEHVDLDHADRASRNKEWLENLTGRLRLEIPRGTWIRSEDMKMEITGDLEVVKTGSYFELFGEVNINRGHYILYGKNLKISEGQLAFQGGELIDPQIQFKTEYYFRTSDKQKRNLEMTVSGKLSEPELFFQLDNQEISNSDAFSYLLFGQPMDELSLSNQNGVVGAMSSSMAAQLVSSQLSKTIGNRLNLDMIEVNATENWQSAAFVVGKYITNDLFVIYQRGFGETKGDEITPESITLEYEIRKNVFLRLQSGDSKTAGFDVILKFETKHENHDGF